VTIKKAAKALGINYSTAKHICKQHQLSLDIKTYNEAQKLPAKRPYHPSFELESGDSELCPFDQKFILSKRPKLNDDNFEGGDSPTMTEMIEAKDKELSEPKAPQGSERLLSISFSGSSKSEYWKLKQQQGITQANPETKR